MESLSKSILVLSAICLLSVFASGQCPWSRELTDLHADCICAYNNVQRLSIQCSPVNFTRLMTAIHISMQKIPIDLLYINNSTLSTIPGGVFRNLDLLNLHISNTRIHSISSDAFAGLEDKLISLSLQNALIKQLPIVQMQSLRALKSLDLSNNEIQYLSDDTFANMQLTTLKLSDNDLNISDYAFRGLEKTLKNLNLKGTNLSAIPKAIENLSSLAFLDLAQNKIANVEPNFMINLHSLTAVNLERNQIQQLHGSAFIGINDSLSSLSLLNNLLVDFPSEAIAKLTGLRVLDLGFNGIRHIPDDAFRDNVLLTLLALDGNPLTTVPLGAFRHLNNTLRGLSIGGKYLECDCRISWIAEWAHSNNLQVTSRERNPQFCGRPEHLKKRTFLHINVSEFICDNELRSSVPTTLKVTSSTGVPQISSESLTETIILSSSHTKMQSSPNIIESTFIIDGKDSSLANNTIITTSNTMPYMSSVSVITTTTNRPEVVKNSPLSRAVFTNENIKIVNALFHNNSIIIEWEPLKSSAAGYQIVHRFFGSRDFKKGPLLPSTQRKYMTPHIPSNECVVICVISLDDNSPNKYNNIPLSQCREIRRDRTRISDLDKIVIGVSAAVCAFVVIAVFVFSCCFNRGSKSSSNTISPVMKSDHEWETVSVYSARSIPRARMYHMDSNVNGSHNLVLDDTRSHISNCYQTPNNYMKHRSLADGQSNRSYSVSQLSHRHHNGVVDNAELTKSQQSLAFSAHHSINTSNSHKRHKSKGSHNRLLSSNSLHSLTECDSDWNFGSPSRIANWKDNEVDIYVDKNYVMPNSGRSKYNNRVH